MDAIRVDAERLVAALTENRAKHAAEFEEAKAGFLATAEEKLLELLAEVREGQLIEAWLRIEKPESHLEDYDRALAMLQWHSDPSVELTTGEFENYVQDKWQWRDRWSASNDGYIQRARRRG
jgi:hypothetical protein